MLSVPFSGSGSKASLLVVCFDLTWFDSCMRSPWDSLGWFIFWALPDSSPFPSKSCSSFQPALSYLKGPLWDRNPCALLGQEAHICFQLSSGHSICSRLWRRTWSSWWFLSNESCNVSGLKLPLSFSDEVKRWKGNAEQLYQSNWPPLVLKPKLNR